MEFQLEFERLVILDYIIRNTDRGSENWLIRYDSGHHNQHDDIEIALSPVNQVLYGFQSIVCTPALFKNTPSLIPLICQFALGSLDERKKRRIKIAAIDNGLAFPFKHPDEIRAYPFQWSRLPYAKIPFSKASRDKFLPILSNINVIEELCSDLYCLFSVSSLHVQAIFNFSR